MSVLYEDEHTLILVEGNVLRLKTVHHNRRISGAEADRLRQAVEEGERVKRQRVTAAVNSLSFWRSAQS